MSQLRIHPDFKLRELSFLDSALLLSFVEEFFPDSYSFLENAFDTSDTIEVTTSGSTGTPKKITILKRAMLRSAEATQQFFDLPSKTTALHCLPTDFIAGKMMWVRAIHLGWHLDVVQTDGNPLKQNEAVYDFAAMVPLQVENSLTNLNRIKKLIIGGAPISYSLKQELKKKECLSFQTYGMTETITHIAIKKIEEATKNHYQCLPGISISQDARACLLIEAPHVSEDKISTNDIVRLISPSEFEWLGRFDNVINSGGIKLFPEQIEEKIAPILTFPFIITALPDEKLGQKVLLLIESIVEISNLEKQLLQTDLSKFEMPKEIHYLQSFVRTKNGKINRNNTLLNINK